MSNNIYDIISEISKRRGFFWSSFEIYGGIAGYVTYGDYGVKLKRNIEALWREYFIRKQGFFEIDDPITNPSKVFEASGHLANFKEYATICNQCGRGFRADHLIEEKIAKEHVEALGGEAIKQLLIENKIKCPVCGGELKEPTLVLTMFQTQIGATGNDIGYMRPEAAQGMFMNFKRCFQANRERIPFAICQQGRVMRNEISPRRGVHRTREFDIMELELFFDPLNPSCPWLKDVENEKIRLLTEDMVEKEVDDPIEITVKEAIDRKILLTEWQGYFMGVSKKFLCALGVSDDKQRFRAHLPNERSHYSSQTFDQEVFTKSWGWIEVSGHANRTDYDLNSHMKASGVDMTVIRPDKTRFIPHVIEPSFGLGRLVYVVMEFAFIQKQANNAKRNIFKFPRDLAPYHISIQPLVSKDGLPEIALHIYNQLLDAGYRAVYDEGGSIGRRYARQDEIGTPLAITIDYDTKEKGIATIRDRDTWMQVSISIKELEEKLKLYYKGAEISELGPIFQSNEEQ
ncbi:glycine--tRNA ligase [Candidatus Bathyarchaeota archaeon]|nr:glycine--tRNA ligase [Candidatus Bathyarchaeota archaeon]